ncbi:exodeoxyribonuclease VII large subunit [Legionella geestiana]|uniref:exodeoxyribonuclease VII large subunit n=1 Tax=Legionella geestiana TaxID=45065 RepID=UPI001092FAD7|nr:exodeoxyribonuclease VII large subunit [Legionella geestiana]QDQ38954.1 exodeoxyribonuclease VII large subunit [Legionella geestiana]
MNDIPLTVTQLNRNTRALLEKGLGEVRVSGEISNLGKPGSGHLYFTLKDAGAQIRCVYFRNYHSPLHARALADGQEIIASGRVSLYEARGDCQLIVTHVEEAGEGLLYRQFCALKEKLAALGLFEAARKRPLPRFPMHIAIVTSAGSAALQDMLSTLSRRYPIAAVRVYPTEVQGVTAPAQIIRALKHANRDALADVVLLARGGGSMEDLFAFNDEALAHAIAQSTIPVISGVGHETDFTIADFVADARAATPTAAAETATPVTHEALLTFFNQSIKRLTQVLRARMEREWRRLQHAKIRLSSPSSLLNRSAQRLDLQVLALRHAAHRTLTERQQRVKALHLRLMPLHPGARLVTSRARFNALTQRLEHAINSALRDKRETLRTLLVNLDALSPLATLHRGYAIALIDGHVVTDANDAAVGDRVRVRLEHGQLICRIEDKEAS